MTTAAGEYEQYEGKRVVLTLKNDTPAEGEGPTKELEGKAEKSNALGILFKPKGKTGLELYEVAQIVSVVLVPEKEKEIKAKTLKIVDEGLGKQHLVDRHGYKLADINAMEEAAAFKFHSDLDHEGLGHVHGAKDASPAAEADDAEGTSEAADSTESAVA